MSSNTVGYEKINVPVNAQDIVVIQFKTVGSDDCFVDLQDIKVEGYNQRGSDWIKIYDPSTSRYVTAYYWGEAADGGVYAPDDEEYEHPLGAGWGDADQVQISATILVGQGFWTKSVPGGTLIFPEIPAN